MIHRVPPSIDSVINDPYVMLDLINCKSADLTPKNALWLNGDKEKT